jgi:hypothetical protein
MRGESVRGKADAAGRSVGRSVGKGPGTCSVGTDADTAVPPVQDKHEVGLASEMAVGYSSN